MRLHFNDMKEKYSLNAPHLDASATNEYEGQWSVYNRKESTIVLYNLGIRVANRLIIVVILKSTWDIYLIEQTGRIKLSCIRVLKKNIFLY